MEVTVLGQTKIRVVPVYGPDRGGDIWILVATYGRHALPGKRSDLVNYRILF